MHRTLVFLLLGTSVLAGEKAARLSPQDGATLDPVPAPQLAASGVRPVAIRKEALVSASIVQVAESLRLLSVPQVKLEKLSVLTPTASGVDRQADVSIAVAANLKVNPKLELTSSALEIEHWVAVHHLLGEDEPPNSLYSGNWLGNWRQRLRKRIAQEGYSAEVMQEFERMKELLSKQPVNRSSGSDPVK